jgi:hypothetical protein
MASHHAPNLAPRLLNKSQAAAYCGMCVSVFDATCPVACVEPKPGLRRWDRLSLDVWIDSLDKSAANDNNELLRMWTDGRNNSAREGT